MKPADYGCGVFAQIEKYFIIPLGVSEFLKNSLIPFPIKRKKKV